MKLDQTSQSRMFRAGALSLALAFASVGVISSAIAEDTATPSAQDIVKALKPKSKTRSLSKPSAADVAADKEKTALIDDLTKKARTRGLSAPERNQLAEIVVNSPSIDIEVFFDFNSAAISEKSKASLTSLGVALQDPALKQATVMVAGHTDAKGKATYNQRLSERRAASVRKYLVDSFNVDPNRFVVVGYGPERLKDTTQPFAEINRRVQVVNLSDEVSSNDKAKN